MCETRHAVKKQSRFAYLQEAQRQINIIEMWEEKYVAQELLAFSSIYSTSEIMVLDQLAKVNSDVACFLFTHSKASHM